MSIEAPRFNIPEDEGRKAQTEKIDSYVDEGINQALALIKERYEDSPKERDNLPFHNVKHSEDVIRRAETILSAIQKADPSLVSERDIAMSRLAGAYHDTVQRWEENKVADGQFTKVLRRRFTGDNEKASAGEGIVFMDEVNSRGESVFSEEDKDALRETIEATMPGWDPVNKTVMQPKLTKESSLVARAVALADLGAAGMDGTKAFATEGKTLFKEENLDILDALRSKGIEGISDTQKEYFHSRMVGWLKFQAGFAQGREKRLETELQAIPESARESVASLFSKFNESISASEIVARRAEAMNFEDVVKDMGY